MSFSHTITSTQNISTLTFSGRLISSEDNTKILNEVSDAINNGTKYFILDLKELEYMNSSGLNVFVSILTKTRNNGGDVIICNVPEKINQLLIITKLNSVFTVTANQNEALEKLSETTNA